MNNPPFVVLSKEEYTARVLTWFKQYKELIDATAKATPKGQSPTEPLPIVVTGGCLCGKIKYAIHCPSEEEWPLKVSDLSWYPFSS
jgi:hypothetical protein